MADQAGRPADWEMAKENIQPLKQGRKMAKLANCLQVRFRRSTVADPHHFKPDPYPSFHFNADPDPMFNFHPDPPIPILIKVMELCGHCSTNPSTAPF